MNDLGKKLSRFFRDYGLGVGIAEEDFIEKIKQAFMDAGWHAGKTENGACMVTNPDTGDYEYAKQDLRQFDKHGNLKVNGQEWYDRFEKIVNDDTDHFRVDPCLAKEDLPAAITNKVLEAAKKAAGIE